MDYLVNGTVDRMARRNGEWQQTPLAGLGVAYSPLTGGSHDSIC